MCPPNDEEADDTEVSYDEAASASAAEIREALQRQNGRAALRSNVSVTSNPPEPGNPFLRGSARLLAASESDHSDAPPNNELTDRIRASYDMGLGGTVSGRLVASSVSPFRQMTSQIRASEEGVVRARQAVQDFMLSLSELARSTPETRERLSEFFNRPSALFADIETRSVDTEHIQYQTQEFSIGIGFGRADAPEPFSYERLIEDLTTEFASMHEGGVEYITEPLGVLGSVLERLPSNSPLYRRLTDFVEELEHMEQRFRELPGDLALVLDNFPRTEQQNETVEDADARVVKTGKGRRLRFRAKGSQKKVLEKQRRMRYNLRLHSRVT